MDDPSGTWQSPDYRSVDKEVNGSSLWEQQWACS